MTCSIPTTFIDMTYATSIPTIVVGTDIPTKLVGMVHFDKSCSSHGIIISGKATKDRVNGGRKSPEFSKSISC